jgi:putative FmdB family regulatory protein
MPIYEYACDKCGHEFEAEQRITDAPLKSCPGCRGRKVRRLISRTSFVLKGSGWYSDLYSSSGAKAEKADAGDSGGAKSPESKTESKSEPAVSDAKSDSKSGNSGKSRKKGAKAAA